MKTKVYFSILVAIIPGLLLVAQEDKNPVAENDYAEAMALQTIVIPVLENDYAYENHPFEIFLVFGGENGTVENSDSTITYKPDLSFSGIDSITYNIKDLENNLVSELAKVYIEVTNYSFEMLDLNQVSCRINAFGLQYWDLGYDSEYGYEVPKGSGKHTIFSETTWIGGLDDTGALHLAAERYRMVGNDYFAGPVMDSAAWTEEQDIYWNRVWKLTSDDIAYHRQHWQDDDYEAIKNITEWPGNGNTELGQAQKLAPYYDWNNNEVYDPENGDFPLIKGDVAVYLIVNDSRGAHTESGGQHLGVEMQAMYYAYDQPDDSALAYTTFCDRKIINRSSFNYQDVYVGAFLDFDIGYFLDDFVGCDTTIQSAYVYNAMEIDGNGQADAYGEHPPAQAYTCLNHDMDGFVCFYNYGFPDAMLDPQDDFEYYNYMTGRWRDSTFFTYGGNGYGGTEPVKHLFTGDPVSGSGWTELSAENDPGDRRGMIASGPYDFKPGDTIHLENALVFARDHNGDNLSVVTLMKSRVQEVRDFYENALGIEEEPRVKPVAEIYPNPCYKTVYVHPAGFGHDNVIQYEVIDLPGKLVKSGAISGYSEFSINLDGMKPGIYFIKLFTKNASITRKIIVEAS